MLPHGYSVRAAAPGDIGSLPEVERIAGLLFKTYPHDLGLTDEMYSEVNSIDTFQSAHQAGRLWIAAGPSDEVVGFALVHELAGYAHLEELDVLPLHGRRGLGSALLDTVCGWAGKHGHHAVTLRTFRDVPWNAPFYRQRGFREVQSTDLSMAHVALEAGERQRGLRVDLRVAMALRTAG